jgi:SHS2 domain-containing protein
MSYEIMQHPADAKFRASGETKKEAFSEAVRAFADIVGGEAGKQVHTIKVDSESLESLLFDMLDELIFLQDTENVVVSHADEMSLNHAEDRSWRLEADIKTNKILPDVNKLDVKGPTYSEMEIKYIQGEGTWVLVCVVDI